MSNQPLLVVRIGDQEFPPYIINKDSISIGRGPENDLVINHPQVSRRHARLFQTTRGWVVENLSQSSPLTLRGRPLTNATPLLPDEMLNLGAAVSLRLTHTNHNPAAPGPARLTAGFESSSVSNLVAPPSSSSSPLSGYPAGPAFDIAGPADQPIVDPAPPRLTVSYGDQAREYVLLRQSITLGRLPDNDIVIPIKTVSRQHAILTRQGYDYVITDQGSTNGIQVNGQKVQSHLLKDGDIIRIGDQLGNVATLTYADPAHPTAPEGLALQLDQTSQAIYIGRAPDNLVVLNYPQVSARHALLRRQSNQTTIEDLGSVNGTFVRGQRLARGRPVQIEPGETFQIASYHLTYYPHAIVQADASLVRLEAFNISKSVNNGAVVLLNNISLAIQPKEFVALVGGSGTGKSTLMDALNGFRPAPEGHVFINGEDYYQNFAAYRSSLGYVPQDDIIHRELTVERALYYVARLRLPRDTSRAEIEQRVAGVLEDVEMTARRKVQVSRLSGGQRKRVSIAVELLARPQLFYLDEPTSGLDPGLDKRMMSLLRRLADQGRTVVLVTHATSNVNSCDKVIFMGRGGRLCFFGPPLEALKFFEVEEFADIYSKLEISEDSPAEWEARYRQSPYYRKYIPPPETAQMYKTAGSTMRPKAARPPALRQFFILTRRYAELVRRDRINLLVLTLQAPIIGAIMALVAGSDLFKTSSPYINTLNVLFMLSIAAVWLGTSNAAREITKENPIYLRERLVNLQVVPYVLSKVAVLSLLCLVQTLMLVGIVLARTGAPDKGAILPAPLEIIIGVFLTTLGGLGMGLLVSSLASNTDKAISLVPIILIPQIILAGVIFDLAGPSKALSYVTVTRWSLDALGTSSDLNTQYFNTIARGQPAAIAQICAEKDKRSYQPDNYAENACQRDPATGVYGERGPRHILLRWAILAGMAVLFIGLACFFQRLKDRAWQRR